ncbi:YbaB/EbfC family nucleoid-associated protein [Marinagarivorans algicola]|uniref:YbaB/EbfC family nucleoid-associated protein n=1 Tax=Marinagarivorans algicola TaxID=1513270 RepID=UPI0006B5B919|nr:YbaB/EbfC family nucleoid-associated protein [Marinagarivorans algicola]
MNGLGDMMKQLQDMQSQMQENMEKNQQALNELEIEGSAGAGLVKVIMNGRHDVKRVAIDDSLMVEDKEMLEDLLAAAVNDCVRKVEHENKKIMGNLTGGMQMPPGFKMPF